MEARGIDGLQSPTVFEAAEELEALGIAEDIEGEEQGLDLTLKVLKMLSKEIVEEQQDVVREMVFVWDSKLRDMRLRKQSHIDCISEKESDPVAQKYAQTLIDLWNGHNEELSVLYRQFTRTEKLSKEQDVDTVVYLQKADFAEGDDECRTALRANLREFEIGLEPQAEVALRASVFLLGQQMLRDGI
jgi:hypothetical protein